MSSIIKVNESALLASEIESIRYLADVGFEVRMKSGSVLQWTLSSKQDAIALFNEVLGYWEISNGIRKP